MNKNIGKNIGLNSEADSIKEDTLSNIKTPMIERCLDRQKPIFLRFIDSEKAFDSAA